MVQIFFSYFNTVFSIYLLAKPYNHHVHKTFEVFQKFRKVVFVTANYFHIVLSGIASRAVVIFLDVSTMFHELNNIIC